MPASSSTPVKMKSTRPPTSWSRFPYSGTSWCGERTICVSY